MNKEIFDQLPADEQPVAAKLNSAADNMKVPQDFQWKLETQLMDAYQNKSQPAKGWFTKLIAPAAWTVAAVLGFVLLNWTIRSIIPSEQAPGSSSTAIPSETFESNVRQGKICEGPLALAHDFSVYVTNQDKTGFIELDESHAIGELRSFAWSADGQLAVVGNTTGTGNIFLWNPTDNSLSAVVPNSELGYLMDAAWSRDSKMLLAWSVQNNTVVYLMNSDGSAQKEIQLGMYISTAPQFAPGDQSIVLYGSNSSSFGLFEFSLDDSQIKTISNFVEDETGFAWSPDGSRLAYFEMDRDVGEARLVTEEFESGDKTTFATLPIPKGSGSSIPDVANLSWSQDGKFLVFEFGRSASDRAIYLANADGTGLVKLVDSAHAPTISSDGNCLAYISNKQAFLLDLKNTTATPLLIADLPAGRSTSDFRLDKLQWKP
ncbi:MAG TPA: hypothetical protein PLA27_01775 [Anaerolineales bacterium]|jgi:WD40 repeat protein|nr:hypothetical protein [Anaerolineales bacterium]HQX15120.1 hypothetical protein [Anaerolineales bacterium]